jgi:hypothetical protein
MKKLFIMLFLLLFLFGCDDRNSWQKNPDGNISIWNGSIIDKGIESSLILIPMNGGMPSGINGYSYVNNDDPWVIIRYDDKSTEKIYCSWENYRNIGINDKWKIGWINGHSRLYEKS